MKHLLIFTAFIIFSLSCFGEANLIFYGDDNFPPYSYVENKELKGIDIDMLNEIKKRTGYNISIKLVPWPRLLELTKLGKIDGAFSLFNNSQREEFSYFTDYPLHYSEYAVFSKRETKPYKSIKTFTGKNIGLNTGFYISDEFQNMAKIGDFTLIESENIENHVNQLLNKRIDYYVGNLLVVNTFLKNNKLRDEIVTSNKLIKKSTEAYLVLSKYSELKNKTEILENVNNALKSIYKDKTYSKILEKYE